MIIPGIGGLIIPGNFADNSWLYIVLVRWPIALAPALFTWLLPGLLRYRPGGMGTIGAALSMLLTVILAASGFSHALADRYRVIHYALYVVFYAYAAAGAALCGVGIYDRKRSAIWAMAAVVVFATAAMVDTVTWFGGASRPAWVPWGFIVFLLLLGIGYLRRRADRPAPPDVRESARLAANNLTRRSRSISRKLLREGRFHLLPAFYLLNLSGLGHEGIANSGSHEFADHIYRDVPTGTSRIGRRLDAYILSMAATRAFRNRYKRAQVEIRNALHNFDSDVRPLRVLAVPCGLPRDLTELAGTLSAEEPDLLARLGYVGMDIDPALLEKAKSFVAGCGAASIQFHHGNALLGDEYPPGKFHCIVSTGLGEFLNDSQLHGFYGNVFDALAPGGTFYTSATREEASSELMMRAFELNTNYRTPQSLERILRQWPWRRLVITQDDSGLQSFVVAVR